VICVDATVAAKWLLPEEYSQEALDLVGATVRAGERILGPQLLPVEITNIIRQRMRREHLALDEARRLLARFFTFHVTLRGSDELHDGALRLSVAYDLPAVYDAHYVALAQQLGCDLWTDDRRLLRNLAGRLPFVRWLGDYRAGRSV
jgi:predicted nucleic acid-binding protein